VSEKIKRRDAEDAEKAENINTEVTEERRRTQRKIGKAKTV